VAEPSTKNELDHAANTGLASTAVKWMEPIYQKYDGLSYAVGGCSSCPLFLLFLLVRFCRSVVSTMCSLLILYSVSGIGIPSFYSRYGH
jgi:hypothetical protein